MYESPVNAFYNEMITKVNESFDNGVLEAVTKVDINVDRDELIKALRYDRGQYDKGFSDGLEEGKPKWISVEDRLPTHGFVLVWCEYTHSIEIAKYKGSLWRTQERRYALNSDWVTHWMPLPEPPKEDTNAHDP